MNRSAFYSLFKKFFYSAFFILISSILSSQVPAITSFSPASGPVGTTVTITGTNFDATPANNIVWFGAVRATVTAASATELIVMVPERATYQHITVTVNGLTAYSSSLFNYTFPSSKIIDASSFYPRVDFNAGIHPIGSALADIDGDEKTDLITVNSSSNSISVFRYALSSNEISPSSFNLMVEFSTGSNPSCVATGDIDGDGKTDIAVANCGSSSVSVLRNISTSGSISAGSFESKVDFNTGTVPYDVAIRDIDGDGKPDLIVTNNGSNSVSILRNLSTPGTINAGSFDSKVDLSTGMNPYRVAVDDIDGDGKPDLAVNNNLSNSITVYRNISTSGSITAGSFETSVDFTTGMSPLGLSLCDIDGNGKKDLIVNYFGWQIISIFKNISTSGTINAGTFDNRVDIPLNITGPGELTIGDIDGDGKPDLAVSCPGRNIVSVFRNTSTYGSVGVSSFSSGSEFPVGTSPKGVEIGDLNGDGKPELIVVNEGNNNVSVLRNMILLPSKPTISFIVPSSGPVGTSVTITGTNFSTEPAENIVWFGAVQAAVTAATNTQLTVTVPAGATYHPVTVTKSGLTASSRVPFNVTFPSTLTIDTTSFEAKMNFVTELNPCSPAAGDFDGDGKPDLVLVDSGNNFISVYRNISSSGSFTSGSFAPRVDFSSGSNPHGIAVGDIDGDGKPDIVVANYGNNSVSVFRNTGISGSITSGSFAARVDFTTGANPYDIAIGDIDGDGKLDLAVTNYTDNTVSILRNTSNPGAIYAGSFAAKVDFSTGNNPYSVVLKDLNLDNFLDMVVINGTDNTFTAFRNTSVMGSVTISTFMEKATYPAGNKPSDAAVGDIDGDGNPDLIVLNANDANFSIFRNASNYGFMPDVWFSGKVDFATPASPTAVAIGDINGDGKQDIVVSNSGSISASVFRNASSVSGVITTGTFTPGVEFTTDVTSSGVAICDLDGDGKPDIIVTNSGGNNVSLLRNALQVPVSPVITSFSPASGAVGTTVTITGSGFSVAAADNYVWFGAVQATVSAASTTELTVTVPAGTTYQPITVTVNGLTAYSSKPFNVTFPSTGVIDAATFATKVDFTTNTGLYIVAIGDIDRDGKPDMVTSFYNGVSVFRNTSSSGSITTGSFANKVDFNTGEDSRCVAIGDIDGDGKLDLAVTNFMSNTVSILRNTSTSGSIITDSFATKVDLTTGSQPCYTAIGDIDGDGKPDLVVTNHNSNSISVYRNISTSGSITAGSFDPRVDLTTGSKPFGVAIGDIDGDGKQDLVVTNYDGNSISVYRNNNISGSIVAGSFEPRVDLAAGGSPYGIAISDIDGDGKLDLSVVITDNAAVSVYRNSSTSGSISTASFAAKVDFTTGAAPYSVVFSDIDGDGKPDMIVSNNGSNTVSLLRNTSTSGSISTSSFAAKVDFPSGSSPRGVAIGDIDGDTKPDMLVPNSMSNSISVFRNAIPESVIPPPVITSFTPTSGPVGTTVMITGTNFSPTTSNNIVWFGAVKATVTSSITTQLTVTVPAGASYQPITVTVNGMTASSNSFFIVTFAGTSEITTTSFSSGVDLTVGMFPSSFAAGDIDEDGKPDLFVSNTNSNSISAFRNTNTAGSISAGLFGPRTDIPSGMNPNGIVISDIDGDGKLDLVVANGTTSSSVSVYRNNGTTGSVTGGSFDPRVDLPTGDSSIDVAVGDIDGDGKPDLVVTNFNSSFISIYRNISTPGSITTGSFAPVVNFPADQYLQHIVVADIDGDKKPDLIAPRVNSSAVSVYRNISTLGSITTGSFSAKVDFLTGMDPVGIAVGDLDGDGKPEIVVANSLDSDLSVLHNKSTPGTITAGSFEPKINFNTGGIRYVTIGDINGDTRPDLIYKNNENSVNVLKNNCTTDSIGPASFATAVEFESGHGAAKTLLTDFDCDGKPDIAYINSGVLQVSILRNKTAEYLPPVITSFNPVQGPVGTTVTINGSNFSSVAADNTVFFGTVQATILTATVTQLTVIVPSGATNSIISVTTYGQTTNTANSFTVTEPTPPPVITSFSPASGPVGTTVTITGSNFSTTAANNIVWFGAVRATVTSATTTQLTATVPTSATYQPVSVTVNGLTGFSKVPFAVTFQSNRTIDASSFGTMVQFATGSSPWSVAVGDIDLDGKPDLAVVNTNSNTVSVFRNTSISGSVSAGSFAARVDFNTGTEPQHVAIGDIDADGKADLVVTNKGTNTVSVFRNTSTTGSITIGSFDPKVDFTTGSYPFKVCIADLDCDGKTDLVVTNYVDGSVSVLRNTGLSGYINSNSFKDKVDFATGINPYFASIGDLDGDGKPDLAVSNFNSSTFSVFRNSSTQGSFGTESFAPKVDFLTGTGTICPVIGDIDADGKPDLSVLNSHTNLVSVFRNISIPGSLGSGSFEPKVDLTTATNPYSLTIGDFNGDGKPDLAVKGVSAVSIHRNTSISGSISTSSFATKVEIPTGEISFSIAVCDFDGDTRPDFVFTNHDNNTISVLRNNMPEFIPIAPSITSFFPTSGPVGTAVTITGSNFSTTPEDNIVMFGDVQATVTEASQNQLTVLVPDGADAQSISVTVYDQTAFFDVSFTITEQQDIELESSILTLNGDGVNEVLRVKNYQAYGQCKFYVYNSRGALIYWNDDFQGEWDVTLHNKRFDTGGYFYVIETSIGTFRGSFSILK